MIKKFDKFITENTDDESGEIVYVLYNFGKQMENLDKRVGVEKVYRDDFDNEEDFKHGINDAIDGINQRFGEAAAFTQEELEKVIYKLHPNH